MNGEDRLKSANRDLVLGSYTAAVSENFIRYSSGDRKATSEYIYGNQKEDAMAIVGEFYHNKRRVVSITKKTKVGADGLMIELAKQMTTHPDDDFVINPANVRILTGMSNAGWEKDMKDKAPYCFKDKIFHHGQLKHSDLRGLKNSLIIIDELDNGDKECQVLHNTLKAAGALDIQYLEENNVRFVFISATMVKELYELYRWGEHHCLYKMTIPDSYIGHTDFLERGIIQEFYSLNTDASATKWVQEDILDTYGADLRVHIVRANKKTVTTIQAACAQNGIDCRNHTSSDKIDESVLSDLFEGALTRHVVLIVKGFFRRANLIPNEWKLRIGATHELYTSLVDNNAQIQALPGRMTGYWRGAIESGHKTGPHRTSVKAVEEYDAVYNDPFGVNSYQAAGFKKSNGRITTITPTFVTPRNISGLDTIALPGGVEEPIVDPKKNVPIVLPMTADMITEICELKPKQKRTILLGFLKSYLRANNLGALADRVDGFEIGQITTPETVGSRKRNIDDPINANLTNRPFTINVKEAHKDKDSWQAVFDNTGNRVIFMIYCNP